MVIVKKCTCIMHVHTCTCSCAILLLVHHDHLHTMRTYIIVYVYRCMLLSLKKHSPSYRRLLRKLHWFLTQAHEGTATVTVYSKPLIENCKRGQCKRIPWMGNAKCIKKGHATAQQFVVGSLNRSKTTSSA